MRALFWMAALLAGFAGVAGAEESASLVDRLLENQGGNESRLPFHADSLASLAVVIIFVVIAWSLNHGSARLRVWGVGFSALACFGLFGVLALFDAGGILSDPRPATTPFDGLKAPLLRLQAFAALVAGFFLLIVWRWQMRRSEALVLAARNEAERYGLVTRYLHWTTAGLFLLLVPMGILMTLFHEDVFYRQGFYVAHKSLGLTVFLLVLLRLVWHYVSPRPSLAVSLKRWERWLAHGVHVMLYVFLLAFPISGFVMSTFGGKLSHFYFWDLPLLWDANRESLLTAGFIHKVVLPYVFYALIAAHILGALKHQFIDKQAESFRRMAG